MASLESAGACAYPPPLDELECLLMFFIKKWKCNDGFY